MNQSRQTGFTLIELSIVLVIIGLIVGGVLVGQDLIAAANIRAQISQIDKYNTAANTFQAKYDCIPGDCTPSRASRFGFHARDGSPGNRDGNGSIASSNSGTLGTPQQLSGESLLFWRDLSSAGMIDGGFTEPSNDPANTTPSITNNAAQSGTVLPPAKIGNVGFIDVYSQLTSSYKVHYYFGDLCSYSTKMQNTFEIVHFANNSIGSGLFQTLVTPIMTPIQEFAIDQKIDDGLPFTGSVIMMEVPAASGGDWPGFTAEGRMCLSGVNACVQAGSPTTYNTSGDQSKVANCSISIQAQF